MTTTISSPSITLISLEEWTLTRVSGKDAVTYLHGQFTSDVKKLERNRYQFTAHCNAMGKMHACMYLFYHHSGDLAFIERSSIQDIQLSELRKYAIFSQVSINSDNDSLLLGVTGEGARTILLKFFPSLPNATYNVLHYYATVGDSTILYFYSPIERFLLIIDPPILEEIIKYFPDQVEYHTSQQWLALDIEAGYPIIDKKTSNRFLPQSANMQELGGISFNKGCYSGQEIIARNKYRGLNKFALYSLEGRTHFLPSAGDSLESEIDVNQWCDIGTVLASCHLREGIVLIQAILKRELIVNNYLRLKNKNILFHIRPLPYPLLISN
ncbi:tRNA-modifying protein YgfZ [Candidatus Schneideria nysicola]|uniref:tRNA-modifying protein YgfZ n=1 Tax=Candidatus Schneideria nysicola TaxID=1081631 RepID=UPI001CAA59CF|nr:tRNA-modifying protein YgfZ [Candidatus Schneideria nysicola]UAJ65845.1 tRNA-modifying protein YgfZ [Candidatus Schneideria nysicola]